MLFFCQVQVMSNVWVWVGANIPLMTWLRLDILSTTLSLRSTISKQIYIPFCSMFKIESHCFWSLSFSVSWSWLPLTFVCSKSILACPLSAEIWCWSSLILKLCLLPPLKGNELVTSHLPSSSPDTKQRNLDKYYQSFVGRGEKYKSGPLKERFLNGF